MFLNYRRLSAAYIVLSLLTLGLYSARFRAELARDLNTACGSKVQDIPGAKFVILNILSFGVYATLWDLEFINLCNKYIELNEKAVDVDLESYRFYGVIPIVRFWTVRVLVEQINTVCRIYSDMQLEDVDVDDLVSRRRVRAMTVDVDQIYSQSLQAREIDLDFSAEVAEAAQRKKNTSSGIQRPIDSPTKLIAGHAVVEEYDPEKDQRRIGYRLRFEREDKQSFVESEIKRIADEERERKQREKEEAEKKRLEFAAIGSYRNKRWLAKTVLLMFFAFVLPFATIAVTVFALPPVYDETYYGELADKYELLKEKSDNKKIIVVGGSSVALGLDSGLIKSEIRGYDVVNFGLSSEIGIKTMLDLSKVGINKGDIIIISPEITDKGMSLYFNGDSMLKALDGNLGLMFHIESEDYQSMLGASLEFTCSKLGYLVSGDKPLSTRSAYTGDSIDEYGDNVYGRPFNETLGMYNEVHFNYKATLKDNEVSDYDAYISYVNEYVHYATRKGATVYYTFSPVCDAALSTDVDAFAISEFYSNLQNVLQCKIISDINNYIFEEKYFYDSELTLNDAGVNLRTVKLIDDIKRTLGSDSRTTKDDDVNPGFLNVPAVTETDDDKINAQHFIFEEYELTSNGETVLYYSIVGLTELGKSVEEFTIPNMYNGAPVVRIAPYAFKESKILKTVNLGKTTSIIDAYAFALSTVQAVYIPSDRLPSDIRIPTVGLVAIDGANPLITFYVSSESVDLFKNDMGFWQCYSKHISENVKQ